MSIDERLERLAARHEALTQTVEIIAGMQRESERRSREQDQRIDRLVGIMESLAVIVRDHERRIQGLEG